jgi:hypothetical protein
MRIVPVSQLAFALLAGATIAPTASAQNYRPIEIEVLASRKENEVKLSDKNKAIDVTILGGLNFSVLEIEKGSIMIDGVQPNSMNGRSVDYNSDRNRDYEYKFAVGKLKIDESTTEICLTGALTDGTKFRGCGPILVKP